MERLGDTTPIRYELDPTGTHIVSGKHKSSLDGDLMYLDRVYDDWVARVVWRESANGMVEVLESEQIGNGPFTEPARLYRYLPEGMSAPVDREFGSALSDPAVWGDFARFANGVYSLSGIRVAPDGRTLWFYQFKESGEIATYAVLRHDGGNRFTMLGPGWSVVEALIRKKVPYRGTLAGNKMRLVSEADPNSSISLSIDDSIRSYPRITIKQAIKDVVVPYGFTVAQQEEPSEELVAFADKFEREGKKEVEGWFSPATVAAYRTEAVAMERRNEAERENMRIGDEMAAEQRARNAAMLGNLPSAVGQVARDNARMERTIQSGIDRGIAQGAAIYAQKQAEQARIEAQSRAADAGHARDVREREEAARQARAAQERAAEATRMAEQRATSQTMQPAASSGTGTRQCTSVTPSGTVPGSSSIRKPRPASRSRTSSTTTSSARDRRWSSAVPLFAEMMKRRIPLTCGAARRPTPALRSTTALATPVSSSGARRVAAQRGKVPKTGSECLSDPVLMPHPVYRALADTDQARCLRYRALVAELLDSAEVDRIRVYLQQQRALGPDRFQRAIEVQLGRCATVRAAHRPKQQNAL